MSDTLLDTAHAAMMAAPEDEAARLAFYARIADGELFLLLEREAAGDRLEPRLFPLQEGPVVVAFDREERLADFAGGSAAYAALPGRVLVGLLAGQGMGLGLNLGAPSEVLLPASAMDWLAGVLAQGPAEVSGRPVALYPPAAPEPVLRALDATLAKAVGLAAGAWLAAARFEGGREAHLLAFEVAASGAEAALARAAAEALAFSGAEGVGLDVVFLAAGDPLLTRMARVGLRFDLTPPLETRAEPQPPGSDPARPPILR